MNSCGLILSLIALLFSIVIIIVHPYIKKITNYYWFWLVAGAILFAYLMYGRFWSGFSDFLHMDQYSDGIVVSRGLLLDLCPFCAIALPTLMIIDPSRKTLRIIAPFAIFGGLITLFGGISTGEDNPEWSFKWIFLGDELNPMYYSMHFINLFFGVWVLLNTDNRKLARIYIYDIVFIILYFIYVLIVLKKYDVSENTTGVSNDDWIYGEYANVAPFFNIDLIANPGKIGLVKFLGYSLATIEIMLNILGSWALQHFFKRYSPVTKSKFKIK